MSGTTGTAPPFAWGADGTLERRKVTQCALSRVCGVCRESLGRPIVFVGTPDEVERNAFHAPPLHAHCAAALVRWEGADPAWAAVSTGGYEFVRPVRDDLDPLPRFVPNSLI